MEVSTGLNAGSVRCAALFGSDWTRFGFDFLTEPSPVSAAHFLIRAPACKSGSFRSDVARTNHRRFSKAWPNIEEEGRGGSEEGGAWSVRERAAERLY